MAQKNLTSEELIEVTRRHNYGPWRTQRGWRPLHVVDAKGCHFTDHTGKQYLDFSSQLMCANLGHGNKAVIRAIEEQARTLPYMSPSHATAVRADLSQALIGVLPEGLTKFFFTTSGTEAIEAALKIARMFTGRTKIIARYRSYHGATLGSIAASGDVRRVLTPVTAFGYCFAPEAHCYRCPLGHSYPACEVACVSYIEHMIENEGDVAAVLVEPVVGTNGVLVPPLEYLPRLRAICDAHGVLLIADEVMSGWGRTGSWFALQHWGVRPDILVTAKGITSAYAPLGVCATSGRIAMYFEDHFFSHGQTYEAHPLVLAPAVATIEEIRRLRLVERAAELGIYLEARLKGLAERHPCVGDIRGMGLLWAVDLVKDRSTKAPLNNAADKIAGKPLVVDSIVAQLMEMGVAIHGWVSHLLLAPPLIIQKTDIDMAMRALSEVLNKADQYAEAGIAEATA